MPNKSIITSAAAVALSLLAGAAFAAPEVAAQQGAAASTANDCHAAPKGVAPQGAHWYYRTDRATKKKCWYLADEVAKSKKAVPEKPSASAEADSSPSEATPSPTADATPPNKPERSDRSIANARAEIPADKKQAEPKLSTEDQKLAESVWPPITEQPEPNAAPNQPAASDGTAAFSSRWPDQVSTAASTDAQTMLARKQAQNEQAAAKPQQPRPSTVGFAITPAAPQEQAPESAVSTLGLGLSVLAGLLALAAIIGPAILRYIRPRQIAEQRPRRAIWDHVDTDNPPAPWDAEQPTRNDNLPRELRDVADRDVDAPQDELEKLLQRVKRSAA
ncbi:hypothetical protein ASC80_08215 [Afipia sp. Root123D2]|uniref:hypothetical protein n=1 Tax=Afipia sp. Root123D2 TaxID=1736436 RepID=UPI0007012900|nr:hypothetical protein [Afipia sp. Root123D2]KQW23253.1 hypothetical protein ASC80_08215 [Afipia sp. Root123D2]